MKSNPGKSTEYTKFEDAMRAVLRASKPDVDRAVEQDTERARMAETRKPKRTSKHASASGHASGEDG